MKTKFQYVLLCLVLILGAVCLISCGDDEAEPAKSEQNGVGKLSYEWVDLGLSVKWAKCNLGASKPEEYGDY